MVQTWKIGMAVLIPTTIYLIQCIVTRDWLWLWSYSCDLTHLGLETMLHFLSKVDKIIWINNLYSCARNGGMCRLRIHRCTRKVNLKMCRIGMLIIRCRRGTRHLIFQWVYYWTHIVKLGVILWCYNTSWRPRHC